MVTPIVVYRLSLVSVVILCCLFIRLLFYLCILDVDAVAIGAGAGSSSGSGTSDKIERPGSSSSEKDDAVGSPVKEVGLTAPSSGLSSLEKIFAPMHVEEGSPSSPIAEAGEGGESMSDADAAVASAAAAAAAISAAAAVDAAYERHKNPKIGSVTVPVPTSRHRDSAHLNMPNEVSGSNVTPIKEPIREQREPRDSILSNQFLHEKNSGQTSYLQLAEKKAGERTNTSRLDTPYSVVCCEPIPS